MKEITIRTKRDLEDVVREIRDRVYYIEDIQKTGKALVEIYEINHNRSVVMPTTPYNDLEGTGDTLIRKCSQGYGPETSIVTVDSTDMFKLIFDPTHLFDGTWSETEVVYSYFYGCRDRKIVEYRDGHQEYKNIEKTTKAPAVSALVAALIV